MSARLALEAFFGQEENTERMAGEKKKQIGAPTQNTNKQINKKKFLFFSRKQS